MNKDVNEKDNKLAIVGFICMIIMFCTNMSRSVNVYMQGISLLPWLFIIILLLIKGIRKKVYSMAEKIFLILSFLLIVGFVIFLIWVLPQDNGILHN